MKAIPRFFLPMLILPCLLLSQKNEVKQFRILHPQPDMQFWVDQIEVAGLIPPGSQVTIGDDSVYADEEGLFRHMILLDQAEVLIPIAEIRAGKILLDTIRVFHRNLDHMGADSVFINNNIPDTLALDISYPRNGKFSGEEVSLRGKTHPDAHLLLNGDTLPVYRSGTFAQHVQIERGENVFEFVASLDGTEIRDTLVLLRPLDPESLAQLSGKSAVPRREHWILTGEHLRLGVRGPESRTVQFKIPGVCGWREMSEVRPGYYSSSFHLRDIDKPLDTEVLYRLGPFSKRIRSAPLRILTEALGGLSIDEDTRVYDAPSTDQLLFQLADSISLQIVGLENRMYKIKLGQYRSAYVQANVVQLHPESRLTAAHFLGSMRGENEDDWAVFRIHTGKTRLPFEIKEKAQPARLELKVYGAKQGWEWTTYPEGDSVITFLERSQPEDMVWQMDFYPKNSFWGWYGRYEGEYLVVGVRRAPEISSDSLFANVIIEIDPGHGGWQRGARGLTGYGEADATYATA